MTGVPKINPSTHVIPAAGALGGAQCWSLRWGSSWGHETCEGRAEVDPSTHADPATGAFGGAPYGATKRVRGVPEGTRVTMRTQPLGSSVELPMGPRNV